MIIRLFTLISTSETNRFCLSAVMMRHVVRPHYTRVLFIVCFLSISFLDFLV